MHRQIEVNLDELKKKILIMGGYVERALEESTRALIERELSRLDSVYKCEDKINQMHIEVDEECVNLLATQSPMAADLRLVVAVIKINTDLERMGDQTVNISNTSKRYLNAPEFKPLVDLPKLAQEVKNMVRDSLDAFVRQDTESAAQVIARDDIADELKDRIFRDVIQLMEKNPSMTEQGLNLILIARNLERLADHATNIAEDVIYAMTGKDIRHQNLLKKAVSS